MHIFPNLRKTKRKTKTQSQTLTSIIPEVDLKATSPTATPTVLEVLWHFSSLRWTSATIRTYIISSSCIVRAVSADNQAFLLTCLVWPAQFWIYSTQEIEKPLINNTFAVKSTFAAAPLRSITLQKRETWCSPLSISSLLSHIMFHSSCCTPYFLAQREGN